MTNEMAENLILSKQSSESEIKAYFKAVLELSKSDNEFPINLDEVWMLVYNRKDYAADALKKDFIENVDFITTSVKTEVGSVRYEYHLTLSCMEFFIARKVRPVFEVYRQVFHNNMNKSLRKFKEDDNELKLRDKMDWISFTKQILHLNDNSVLMLMRQVAEPLGLPLPDYVDSKGTLKSATELIKQFNVGIKIQAFNALMVAKGLLEVKTRKSHKGDKKFKALTEPGLSWGENQVTPANPNEVQPRYYEAKFKDLLGVIGVEV